MDVMIIKGGKPLTGSVATSGAKNAALPLLFATLLADGEHRFENVPFLKDIDSTELLLNHLNCETYRDGSEFKVIVKRPESIVAPYDIVRKMRASILCLGPLLAKYGEAKVSLPGGCAIGSRPINLHIEPLRQLGAEIEIENGYVIAKAERLIGDRIVFDFATVGGTENIMMAASLCRGTTILENVAKEPEIVDLAQCLRGMGANIEGEGSSVITIEGVDELKPANHRVIPDRIEAGTLLIAGAITGGDVKVTNCVPKDIDSLINKLIDCGFEIETGSDWVRVRPCSQWRAVDVDTAPHPGFPTDLQAQFMALMTQAKGTSVITERIFENRFMHVQELARMGANITPKSQVSVVRGEKGGLSSAPVMATDLRASASLILAALATDGETTVSRIYHLDRGYEKLEVKLQGLGAQIERRAI
ncbi:MAG: UDP-N-acetylglucosamine 1-carboxyvinyltransferase [Xanthomonadales bacterium]|nr:UDP-N-acetylglucosamine 1-carboxyvinyltransferase [Xanthomonadales bacterium]